MRSHQTFKQANNLFACHVHGSFAGTRPCICLTLLPGRRCQKFPSRFLIHRGGLTRTSPRCCQAHVCWQYGGFVIITIWPWQAFTSPPKKGKFRILIEQLLVLWGKGQTSIDRRLVILREGRDEKHESKPRRLRL